MKIQDRNACCCYCGKEIVEGEGRYLMSRDRESVYSCVDCYPRFSQLTGQASGRQKKEAEVRFCRKCRRKLSPGTSCCILMKDEEVIYFCGKCAGKALAE